RGDVLDRNGVILATTLPTASLYADPAKVIDAAEAAEMLAATLPDLDYDAVLAALTSSRRFVWLRRGLTPSEHYQVNRLGLPGIAFQNEERRYYPHGPLAAHAVGFTDVDGTGLAGIEKTFDRELRTDGGPLRLSLDVRLQALLQNELQVAIDEFQALGGAGLIMHARSGEILAMVSLPDFNPARPEAGPAIGRFNRTTLGVYEMGSTFKVFNTAMALDSGIAGLNDGYDAREPIRIGRYTINDFHPQRRWLSVGEIFMHSSNIGSVHMAVAAGTRRQQDYLDRFGLLAPPAIELPEVASPMVPTPWREINTMTIAYGHGMAVSPLQLSAAVAATVNGGILLTPTLIPGDRSDRPTGTRVLSAATSDTMRRLLRLAVVSGTGGHADAPGYLVGGKTGTAEKAVGPGYDRRALLSSFVAAFPMTSPEYVVFAMLDEPRGNERTFGYATGGWVAAPLVGRVIERMGPMVGLAPLDPEAPEIREALHVDLPRAETAGPSLAAFAN
ncbi:MAG: penicillin-binding protein 2, partial [Inquilinus sp.]|nr:penicillin-binding protein 2 [Inquilinus sp.]